MKNLKTTLFVSLAFFLLAACAPTPTPTPVPTSTPLPPTITPAPTVAPLDIQRTLTVGDMERSYFIHIPEGLTSQQALPLVFVFHGYQESGTSARNYTGFDQVADENGFIVVYPNGRGSSSARSWNASGCCGYALQNEVDEPAFVRAIIADVETILSVDAKRIYATGFSNGALLSYRLACEMSDTFAAVAPAGGVLMYEPCAPQQPVSLMHVHGMQDSVVPFDGGGSGIQFPPVEESLNTWITLDGCSGEEQTEQDGILTHTTYGVCEPGISVELYAIDGIGHSWPSQYVLPISQTIWEFFAAHPKP
jgi:polyhydroxybutyrate depolymerase